MAIFIASIVMFKFLTALWYTTKWNIRFCCSKKYSKSDINNEAKWEELKNKKATKVKEIRKTEMLRAT